jgi:hypothetical protein
LTVGAAGSISMNGSAGQPAANVDITSTWDAGGAGGGSGGLILLQASSTLTLASGSTLSVAGGDGGPASCGAGAGPGIGAAGGNGGGGGYIILNSPSISDSSTKNLSGGAVGASVAIGSWPNSYSAGFAGTGAGELVAPVAGGAGLVLVNLYS